jgi:hypothetical protein
VFAVNPMMQSVGVAPDYNAGLSTCHRLPIRPAGIGAQSRAKMDEWTTWTLIPETFKLFSF